MARSAGRSEHMSALLMIGGSMFAIGHVLWTEHGAVHVALGLLLWTSVLALLVAQYRLLGGEGFYGSALYHRLLILTAALVWLPFAISFVQDLAGHRSVSPWAVVLFGWVALTMWSGWRAYRTAQATEAAHQ